jgi:hypothetical protein
MAISNEPSDFVDTATALSQCLLDPQLSYLTFSRHHYDVCTTVFTIDFHTASPIFVRIPKLSELVNKPLRGDHVPVPAECSLAHQNTVCVSSRELESIYASHDLLKSDLSRR